MFIHYKNFEFVKQNHINTAEKRKNFEIGFPHLKGMWLEKSKLKLKKILILISVK